MAFTIGGTGPDFPEYNNLNRPTATVGACIYNTDTKSLEIYTGTRWEPVGTEMPFLYRQVITTGYVGGGYKSSSPWKNVNKMNHATDVMSNLGDLFQYAQSYTSGFNNKFKAFLWGADDAWPGTSTQTAHFDLVNETTMTANTSYNMTVARNDSTTCFKEDEAAFICAGGSTQIDHFNGMTETMSAANTSWVISSTGESGGGQFGCTSLSDENCSVINVTNNGTCIMMDHNTAVSLMQRSVSGTGISAHGQQKGINSKLGRGWAGNEGSYNGGYNLRRWSFATETVLGTVAKPITNCGEENFDMGQAHQYCHGNYDGVQNNRSWKFYYNTETGSELSGTAVRTGVPGGSSGHGYWRG